MSEAAAGSGSSSPPSRKRPRLLQPPAHAQALRAPALPTAAEERRLFRLWLQASQLAAAAAVHRAQQQQPTDGDSAKEPDGDRRARRAAHDAYLEALRALGLEGKGLAYDPLRRRFVDHFVSIDGRPSSRLYFQHYPVAAPQLSPHQPPPTIQRRYALRVVNPDTKRRAPPSTVDTLERYLPRRYRGACPQRLGVLRLGPAGGEGGEVDCRVGGVEVRVYDAGVAAAAGDGEEGAGAAAGAAGVAAAAGAAFNRACLRAVEADRCDALLVWRNAASSSSSSPSSSPPVLVLTELFYPTYPALLGEGLLLLTPLHLYQLDGCEAGARDVIQSLLDRASGVLGALVVDRDAGPGGARLPYLRYDRQRHQREPGLAHARAAAAAAGGGASGGSIEADGRALRITGRLRVGRYVPTFPHGWLSDDTAILLATALRVFEPRCVLELGAWLGLSSRFILREGRASVRRFVTVDHFKNTAVGNGAKLEDVTPLDKLYFHHLRFETFYANMERHVFGPRDAAGGAGATSAGQEDGAGSVSAAAASTAGPEEQEEEPPEVVMLRLNVHEAPQLLHAAHEPCDLVFIDAEKDAARLARLLRTVARLFPRAVVVGDDLAFPGVKQALVDVGVPEGRLVRREEAYLILPPSPSAAAAGGEEEEEEEDGKGRDKAAVVRVMEQEVAPRLAVPAWQREVVALIAAGKDEEAAALGAEHGLGLGDVLYSPGKSILHDVCRRRDKAALAFWGRFVEGDLLRGEGEEEEGGKRALVPVNDVGLTPFDYLTDVINF